MITGPKTHGKYHKHGYSHTRIDNFQSVYVCNRILNRQAINYNRIEFFGEF